MLLTRSFTIAPGEGVRGYPAFLPCSEKFPCTDCMRMGKVCWIKDVDGKVKAPPPRKDRSHLLRARESKQPVVENTDPLIEPPEPHLKKLMAALAKRRRRKRKALEMLDARRKRQKKRARIETVSADPMKHYQQKMATKAPRNSRFWKWEPVPVATSKSQASERDEDKGSGTSSADPIQVVNSP